MKKTSLMIKIVLGLLLLGVHSSLLCQEGVKKENDDPLAFLEDMIGKWYADPDEETLKKYPELKDLVIKQFEWADSRKKFMNFYENVANNDVSNAVLTCQIAPNPRSGIVQFQGYQARNDFYYYGRFEPPEEGKGYTWIYDVHYPESTTFDNEADRKRGYLTYRTTCKVNGPDSMLCTTEYLKQGIWKPWGTGEANKYKRME